MNDSTNLEGIAIIGIGAIMPGALNKEQYWKNILEGKSSIIEVPQDRWDWKLYYDPDPKALDKTYSKIGGFIEGFRFDSIKHRIPPQVGNQMDRLQQMAVEASVTALDDAGYSKKPFASERTAVILGNSMGGMKKEETDLRIYRAYYNDVLSKTKCFSALSAGSKRTILHEVDDKIASSLGVITEDTMPGELSNVTAGRIANVLNLNGPNFTVDAACASSIAALDQAVHGLRSRDFDMALCGGADQMMSAPAYVKFCKIGALSPDGSWAFDARANGFVMAEGVGIMALKRLSDAVKAGDKIYAVIKAIGASSDGKGKGITAPNPKGQKLAVERAFEQLNYTPADVGLMEAHGTATKAGDPAEVGVLNEVFSPYIAAKGSVWLGSVKSQIGHCKAASGAASVIKIALALHHKTLPPSINFKTPNPDIDFKNSPFRVITKADEWKSAGRTRRANVSAFGFGGTNFHIALEEYDEKTARLPAPRLYAEAGRPLKEMSYPPLRLQSESITISGRTKEGLFNELSAQINSLSALPDTYPMAALTLPLNRQKPADFAVALTAESPSKLKDKLGFFMEQAQKEDVWTKQSLHLKMKGIYPFRPAINKAKIGFLFPGQGSQYVDMMKDLAEKYRIVQNTFDEADEILKSLIGVTLTDTVFSKPGESAQELAKREDAIKQTQMTQPAVLTADTAMMRLLASFGVKPDIVCGHSLGEYAAAIAAGIFTFENGLRAVTNRAKEMSNIKVKDPGKMASVAMSCEKVEKELKKINGYVICANKNCPTQTVIAGEKKAVEDAVKHFTAMGAQSGEIPVSHAFHSAIIEPAAEPYRNFLAKIPVSAPKTPILSNVTADYFPSGDYEIRDMFVKQITRPVEFIRQLERMYEDGVRLFVECGPKRVLSALATGTLQDKRDILVLSANHPKRGGILEFNDLLANMTAAGVPLNWNKKNPLEPESIYSPAYSKWAETASGTNTQSNKSYDSVSITAPQSYGGDNFCAKYGINTNPIAISGIAAGTPGSWDKLFREGNIDEILRGQNFIEPISQDKQQKQIDKNVVRVIKSALGDHSIERLDSITQAIKLAAVKGQFDIEKEFGVPQNLAKAMDTTFRMAIGAGVLALKDAGIPLLRMYKKTSTGGYLPERWALPESIGDQTGVIFASAFPVMESLIKEISSHLINRYKNRSRKELWEVYDSMIQKLHDQKERQALSAWFAQNFSKYHEEGEEGLHTFSQNFLLKAIPIGNSQFAQWVRARGPAVHISAACASTTEAVGIAEDWIRLGRAKRVIVIAADDITNETVQEWSLAGFLASGAATTQANLAEAALPFDRRRHGLIVGTGAVGIVVEDETLIRKRGMKPLARILGSEFANSAFHVTRLDTNHVGEIMNRLVSKVERIHGLNRSEMAGKLLFMSHETYTPARGGSASAEVVALKKTFGKDAGKVVVSNVKGFTGHTMGASLEDVVAIRALNTGIVPPIANYKEPDPELAGINLSKGGEYDLEYALRLGAGFGSQNAMTLVQRTLKKGEKRIDDPSAYKNWLKEISGRSEPELETVFNTLRIKDAGVPIKTAKEAVEAKEAREERIPVKTAKAEAKENNLLTSVGQAKTITKAETITMVSTLQSKLSSSPSAVLPHPSITENSVKTAILDMVSAKTGYPKDMLELDLDMEADLGIDTVKQAELFAGIREHYGIPRREGLALKDYPTIRHCIKFVIEEKGITAAKEATEAKEAKEEKQTKTETTASVKSAADNLPLTASDLQLTEDTVKNTILDMVSAKTGYPKDMLELDLDMEADLGIDTVKQAELFAGIREHYGIPRREGLALKDYPTIRHCIKFVIEEKGMTIAKEATEAFAAKCEEVVEAGSRPIPIAIRTGQSSQAGRNHNGNTTEATEARKETEEKQKKTETTASMKLTADNLPLTASDLQLTEDTVKNTILDMVSAKTGYPKDMLELDLDMEADLGIDTVKQAELFAGIREHYGIPRREGLALKDYPTIRLCIKFVLEEKTTAKESTEPSPSPLPQGEGTTEREQKQASFAKASEGQTEAKPAPRENAETAAVKSTASGLQLTEDTVKNIILDMVSAKTGYPKDMLELDLDMEADLGIDTVKQAELFAGIREHYGIPRREGLALKDYPTIRHCIKFVIEEKGMTAAKEATEAKEAKKEKQKKTETTASMKLTADTLPLTADSGLTTEQLSIFTPVSDIPARHIRYVPMVTQCPAENGTIKKLSTKRPVLIFSDDQTLTKAFQAELDNLRLIHHTITSYKSRARNTTLVNWNDIDAVEKTLKDFAQKHPDTQGIIYLLGCESKKLDKDTSAHADLIRMAMPLFLAAKYFSKSLSEPEENAITFMAVATKVDGAFGYKTTSSYDPIYGAISGMTYCLRKELEKSVVKLIDFAADMTPSAMARKTFHEVLDSDGRLAVGYHSGKRLTLINKPFTLKKDHPLHLKGKTVLVTGAGRGLGAEFCKLLAKKCQPHVVMLDIIPLQDKAEEWAVMSDEQLKEYKNSLWTDMKASMGKQATPVMLEKEFAKVKDSVQLYRTMEEMRRYGSEAEYFCCDVNDSGLFADVIRRIKAGHGRIEGLVHFAGFERSKLAVDKTLDEFFKVFDTKAVSALNFLKSGLVKENGFWALISSIAGRFGNVGQTDYAAASDYMSKLAISLTNSGIRALAVDMSAYANIGMAIRPGVETYLKSQGVDFLYPEEGMNAVLDEILYGKEPEIVLSGSLGKLDFDKQLMFEGAAGPASESAKTARAFMEKTVLLEPSASYSGTKEFSLEKDPYLKDHSIAGTPYVPGVMAIETMAEAAEAVSGSSPACLENVIFSLPVKLLRNKSIEVRVGAVHENGDMDAKIESDFINSRGVKMGSSRTHFTAHFSGKTARPLWDSKNDTQALTASAVSAFSKGAFKAAKEEIYKLFFHGPSFQVLAGITKLDSSGIDAVYQRPAAPLWNEEGKNLIARPLLIEAAFQACGFRDIHFAKKMTLPDAIGRVHIPARRGHEPEILFVHSVFKGHDKDGKSLYDGFVFDSEGQLWIEIDDYVMIPV